MELDVARTIDELRSLSIDDRLKVVQAVWDSLPEQPTVAISPEQRAELERRVLAYEANPNDLLTWDQVLDGLRGRL
jgi:putative addiction module component (TIGR02574 family)